MVQQQFILIVEPDSALSDLYVRVLSKLGYKIKALQSAKQCLAYLKKPRESYPDAIYIDASPTDISSTDLIKMLRTDSTYNVTKAQILLLATIVQKHQLPAMTKRRVDGVITKNDVSRADLVRLVHAFDADGANVSPK